MATWGQRPPVSCSPLSLSASISWKSYLNSNFFTPPHPHPRPLYLPLPSFFKEECGEALLGPAQSRSVSRLRLLICVSLWQTREKKGDKKWKDGVNSKGLSSGVIYLPRRPQICVSLMQHVWYRGNRGSRSRFLMNHLAHFASLSATSNTLNAFL